MIEYYIFLAIAMIFAFVYDKNPKSNLSFFMLLAVLTLFAGMRSVEVGTDASSYARSFEKGLRILEGDWEEKLTDEVGFYYLNKFLSMTSNQYWVLFMGIALLTYSCVLTAIKRETNKLQIPLFVFITLGLYTFVFNAARQGIAVSIYMLSFKYLFDRKKVGFIKYCVFVLLAALFHKTAIITLPLYFLFRLKYSPKILFLVTGLGIAMGFVLQAFLTWAGTQEARYVLYSTQASGGELLTVFYVFISLFFIYRRKEVDAVFIHKYDVFLNMMLFGTLIYVVVQVYGVYVELTRFAAYFQVASIFLWGIIYQSRRKPRGIYSVGIILGHLIFYFIFCTRMANLTPYIFNPNLW